jgi:hypothetical protein
MSWTFFFFQEELQTGLIPALALHLDMPTPGGCVEELDTKVVVCRMLVSSLRFLFFFTRFFFKKKRDLWLDRICAICLWARLHRSA